MKTTELFKSFSDHCGNEKAAAKHIKVTTGRYNQYITGERNCNLTRLNVILKTVVGDDFLSLMNKIDIREILKLDATLKPEWADDVGYVPVPLLDLLLSPYPYVAFTPDHITELFARFEREFNLFDTLRDAGVLIFYRRDLSEVSPLVVDAILNKYSRPPLVTMYNAYVDSGVITGGYKQAIVTLKDIEYTLKTCYGDLFE